VIDDGAAVRCALSLALARDQDLEVAGTAANARMALAIFSTLKPDLVLLDFETPEMDGLATVRELR
jgi:two-component system chemotaxis response regulator CheB